MSTTDTRAAFEAWYKKEWHTEPVGSVFGSPSWKAWQAATEAAKATGTAGELPPLPMHWAEFKYIEQEWVECGPLCNMPAGSGTSVYTGDQMREYGQACAEASRQPAPVDEIEQVAKAIYQLIPGDGQGSPTDHPWQPGGNSHMQDLARRMARAALAATNRSQP